MSLIRESRIFLTSSCDYTMRIRLQLILCACIVNFAGRTLQLPSQKTDEGSTGVTNDGTEIQHNIQNLFDYIANNEAQKSGLYRDILKQEVAKGHEAYDALEDELSMARSSNVNKRRTFSKNVDTPENVVKRETDENTCKDDAAKDDGSYAELLRATNNNDLGAFRSVVEDKGVTALREWFVPLGHIAAAKGHLDIMRYIVEIQPWTAEERNDDGDMMAHVAAKHGHLDIVQYLARKAPQAVERRNSKGDTIGHIAAKKGHVDIIRFLAEERPRMLRRKDATGQNALHLGLRNNFLDVDVMDDVCKKSYRVSLLSIDKQGDSLASLAAERGNLDIMQYIARRKPSGLRRIMSNGRTMAHIAAEKGHAKIVEYLAEKFPALLNETDGEGDTVVQVAAKQGHLDVIQSIEKMLPTLLRACCENVAELALKNGHLNVFKYLLKTYTSRFTKPDHDGHTVLDRVVHKNLTDWKTLEREGISLSMLSNARNKTNAEA